MTRTKVRSKRKKYSRCTVCARQIRKLDTATVLMETHVFLKERASILQDTECAEFLKYFEMGAISAEAPYSKYGIVQACMSTES